MDIWLKHPCETGVRRRSSKKLTFVYLIARYVVSNFAHIAPPDSVGESIMFSGCPSIAFVRSFVCSSGQISLLHSLMNGLN